jgi:hypothetical protein
MMNKSTKRIADLALSDTGFAFDPYSGATFTLNATGVCVLTAMKEGLAPAAVEERLRTRFDACGVDVARDVSDFVALLRQHGIVGEEA